MSEDVGASCLEKLDLALDLAEETFANGLELELALSDRLRDSLDVIHSNAKRASAVFTNIITCLAIKSAKPYADVRYHQTQIQKDTKRSAGVNFRTISENTIYPWLDRNNFEGAKSGWQTRTLERPKPYTIDYDENIAFVKRDFLIIFDELETNGESGFNALAYLVYKQVIKREDVKIKLSIPKTGDINIIVDLFSRHFFQTYKDSKGASRLPVLALHAIYSVMVQEVQRYSGKSVVNLNEHSAADAQTGSIGDIEVLDDTTGEVFEAVEVKHNIQISQTIAASVRSKIMDKSVNRYYILTTHKDCTPDDGAKSIIGNIQAMYNCQVIANGVLATIRYYLRLLVDPSNVFKNYIELLKNDKVITHEHRTVWNSIIEESENPRAK
jgi:DNA (cytosine-5)-methyltransferase 1